MKRVNNNVMRSQVENMLPHAVCVPFPAQGHINPMFKLAKLLHQKGFHITFVNSEYNQKRLLRSRGRESFNALPPSFRFETIPDGLPFSDADSTQDIPSLCDSTSKTCLVPFKQLLSRLNSTASSENGVPPVSCVIGDTTMSWTHNAAQELGVPGFLCWTASACGLWAYLHYPRLVDEGFVPLKDESYLTNGFLDTVIDWIPGLEGMSLKYFPSFVRTTDPDDIIVKFAIAQLSNALKASTIIINSFDELEHDILNHISQICPPIYTVGPIQKYETHFKDNEALNSLGSNLWIEQPGCLEWLDLKEAGSVVYVNFGSITVMTPQQLNEFAWGLAGSGRDFLWVIRPDLVNGESAILPPEFSEQTKERGLLCSWTPQEEILKHPAIGGFLTHCGWNSILESLCGGVPMICWPFFAEQQTNCWFICNKWKIGCEIDSDVKRSEIEKLVREVMEGEKGKYFKRKVLEWKRLAEEATVGHPSGSSSSSLDTMIDALISPRTN